MNKDIIERAKQVELLMFDIDGVLTDGRMYFDDTQTYKAFNSRDGLGMVMARQAGLALALVSGHECPAVTRRFANFEIKHLYQGIKNKREILDKVLADLDLTADKVAYLGDDLIDLPVMEVVGLPCAVADADSFVQSRAKWVTVNAGGRGAGREFCEMILDAKGVLDDLRAQFLS